MAGKVGATPVEVLFFTSGKGAQRRTAVVRPGQRCGIAAVRSREVDRVRKRIEKDFRSIETITGAGIVMTIDAIGIADSSRRLRGGYPAMPDSPRLVHPGIQNDLANRIDGILLTVEKERDAGRAPRVQGEVPGFQRLDPGGA